MSTHSFPSLIHSMAITSLMLLGVVQLSGCADTPHADAAYGDAYRHMVQQQTQNQEAAENPSPDAADRSDAQRLSKALEVYRGDVGKGTTDVKQTLEFDVGK